MSNRFVFGLLLEARTVLLRRHPQLTTTNLVGKIPRYISQLPPSPDTIIINQKAVEQMKKVCTDGSKLRITVEGGGCSGFQYHFSVDDQTEPMDEEDICISYKDAQVVIDPDSLEFVRGSTLDYNTELIRSAFRLIDNPQAEAGCSCGASFAIKD